MCRLNRACLTAMSPVATVWSSNYHFSGPVLSCFPQPHSDFSPKQQLNADILLTFLISHITGRVKEALSEFWPMCSWVSECWMSIKLTVLEQTDLLAWLPDSPWLSTCPNATYWRRMATGRPLLTLRNGLKRFCIVLFNINVTKCHEARVI